MAATYLKHLHWAHTAVGIGASGPVLYSLASYGQKGVERMVQLLKDELIIHEADGLRNHCRHHA